MKVNKNEETLKIGKELEDYIKWVGLTPESFSEASKIPLSTVERYLAGEEIIIEDAKKIANIFSEFYLFYIPSDKRIDAVDFMRRIKDFAEDHDIQRKELAAYLGYSESALSKIMSKESMTVKDLVKIANFYRISTAHLTGEIAQYTLYEHFKHRQNVFEEAKILLEDRIETVYEYQGILFELPLDENMPKFNALLTRLESSVLQNFWFLEIAKKKSKYKDFIISSDELYDDLMQIVLSIVEEYGKKVKEL